jgi:hypothetical protein
VPKITKTQIQGNAGEAAIVAYFSQFGWLGEIVRNDFGDDIIFQFQFNGKIEPFRIVCQVKTTANKRVTLRTDTIKKWILSLEHFIVVVVDPTYKTFRYAQISEHFSIGGIWGERRTSLSISLDDFRELDQNEVSYIEWVCRVRGLNRLLLEIIGWREHADPESEVYTTDISRSNLDVLQISALLLEYIGFADLSNDSIKLRSHVVVARLLAIRSVIIESRDPKKIEEGATIRELLLIVLLYRMSELVKDKVIGIPGGLMNEAHRLLCCFSQLDVAEIPDALDIPFA